MRVLNKTRGSTIASNLKVARSFGSRLKGLLGKKELPDGEGILLEPAYQIHTMFMKFSIDVLFVDKCLRIVHLIRELKPFRISGLHIGASKIIELPGGTIAKSKTEVGDFLTFEN